MYEGTLESAKEAFKANNHYLAFNYFIAVANNKHELKKNRALAYRMIGQYYQYGYGNIVNIDIGEAIKKYQIAFRSGDPTAGTCLRSITENLYTEMKRGESIRQEQKQQAQIVHQEQVRQQAILQEQRQQKGKDDTRQKNNYSFSCRVL